MKYRGEGPATVKPESMQVGARGLVEWCRDLHVVVSAGGGKFLSLTVPGYWWGPGSSSLPSFRPLPDGATVTIQGGKVTVTGDVKKPERVKMREMQPRRLARGVGGPFDGVVVLRTDDVWVGLNRSYKWNAERASPLYPPDTAEVEYLTPGDVVTLTVTE